MRLTLIGAICYFLTVRLPPDRVSWRLYLALLPYAGDWAYRDLRENNERKL
jgi:hypothetical protein